MAGEQEASASILKALKFSQRGLSVTDLSKKISHNRNSIAKQLEILRAEGKVEVRKIGSARVYSLAQRVPLSAFLCFTRNMILILDRSLTIVQANDQYIGLTGLTKQELIGRNILAGTFPIVSSPEALGIIQSTGKEQVITDIRFLKGKEEFFYKMEVIPTTFEAGETGLTIVLEDITEKKRHLKNMEFLARTAMELVDLPLEIDIFEYIADRVGALVPGGLGFVDSYDQTSRQFIMRAIFDQDFREGLEQLIGQDVVGMTFRVDDLTNAPHHSTVSTVFLMREHIFHPEARPGDWSFYDLCFRKIPQEVCNEILARFNIGKLIGISFIWKDQLFGVVGIFLPPEQELNNQQAIESFIRKASIAIARRMTEDRLLRSEQRFRDLVTLADHPAAVIGPDDRITLVNPRFSEEFGYMSMDIPTGDTWLEKAFPDPVDRKEAVAALNPDGKGAGKWSPGTFPVRCMNGEVKNVHIQPLLLSDGTKVITFDVNIRH